MRIRIGHELIFEIPRPTPMLLMLYVHPDTVPALRQPEAIHIEPVGDVESFGDGGGAPAA